MSERLDSAVAETQWRDDPAGSARPDDPAGASGVRRPAMTTLTSSLRREAFAANAAAAKSTRASKQSYVRTIFLVDLALVTIATLVGYLARFKFSPAAPSIPVPPVVIALVLVWM